MKESRIDDLMAIKEEQLQALESLERLVAEAVIKSYLEGGGIISNKELYKQIPELSSRAKAGKARKKAADKLGFTKGF